MAAFYEALVFYISVHSHSFGSDSIHRQMKWEHVREATIISIEVHSGVTLNIQDTNTI